MSTPSSDNVLLGKGSLFFDRYDANGVATGYRHLGNCSTFEVGTEDDVLELRSSLDSAAGVYKKVTRERKVNLSVTGYEFDAPNLALILMGSETALLQSTAAVVDEVLVAATVTDIAGKYFQTARRGISALVLDQGASTLVLDTDYEIMDAEQGIIRILPTSPTVADGTAILADYTSAAIVAGDGDRLIAGAVSSKIEGKLLFRPDPQTGPKIEGVFWNVSWTPDGVLGLVSDDWGTWSLSGTAQNDSAGQHGGSASYPYYQLIKRG